MDAGVDGDEEWLGGKRVGPPFAPSLHRGRRRGGRSLRGEEFRLKVYDLLLFFGGWPRPVALRVDDGGVDRLMRQIAQERIRIITVSVLVVPVAGEDSRPSNITALKKEGWWSAAAGDTWK